MVGVGQRVEEEPHEATDRGQRYPNQWKPNLPSSSWVELHVSAERVQKGIVHWDKQNHAVPAPNCVLKVRGEIIKVEGL